MAIRTLLRAASLALVLLGISAIAPATTTEAQAQSVAKIGTVDFQRAIGEVNEGKATKTRLEKMYEDKKMALQKMEQQMVTAQKDYEKQAMVLSDAARKQKEQELMQQQAVFQQTYMQSEQEFQAVYGEAMEGLITKLRTTTELIAKEKGYALVVEVNEGGVVYSTPANDLTAELITRFNSGK
jgi:outer membrane protein